jgi:hypothetical protein
MKSIFEIKIPHTAFESTLTAHETYDRSQSGLALHWQRPISMDRRDGRRSPVFGLGARDLPNRCPAAAWRRAAFDEAIRNHRPQKISFK